MTWEQVCIVCCECVLNAVYSQGLRGAGKLGLVDSIWKTVYLRPCSYVEEPLRWI